MVIRAASPVFGKNLKYLRESKGLSLTEMAALIGMEAGELEGLEQGRNFEIDYSSVCRICHCFDGDMDHLFDRAFYET